MARRSVGGGRTIIAFEAMHAEERYAHEPVDRRTRKRCSRRRGRSCCSKACGNGCVRTLRRRDAPGVFETLLPFLLGEGAPPCYREVARKLDASETAVRLLVFRMRGQFRDRLREEVARTVASPGEVAAELEWLRTVLSTP
jgi:RNA polymerase sigma-70 factor (ECF subfamily)